LENVTPDLILLDVNMPEMDGYKAIMKLKSDRRYTDIPVIFLSSKSDEKSEMRGFDLGAADYVLKPFSLPLLVRRIENQLFIAQQKAQCQRNANDLSMLVVQKNAEVFNLQGAIIKTVAHMLELRDKHSAGHIERAQLYIKALIEGLFMTGSYLDEISEWNLDLILPSVQLYDIGKVGIPDYLLAKPARLTTEESEVMRTHVQLGIDAVNKAISETSESAFLLHALHIVGGHHERWDGGGYPGGLRGAAIPLEARLMAIADVYDALVSWRPYKRAYTHEEAVKIITEGAGTQFDPDLITVFRNVEAQFREVGKSAPKVE
jgi:putative two-component system response regulator